MFLVRRYICFSVILICSVGLVSAQNLFQFPSLSEARSGFTKPFKVPNLKDFDKFSSDYTKHLKLLDRRREKAYRKSFLKFIETEDKLLYTLCDSNEFRANALMRSSIASYGKLERDRRRTKGVRKKFSHKEESLKTVAEVSHTLIPELDTGAKQTAEKEHKETKERYGSELYAGYMQKRVGLYQKTFRDGTKQQKRLYRKLRKRAALWKAYKANDAKLISDFADDNMGIMRSVKATPDYQASMKDLMPDYSGTQLDENAMPSSFDMNSVLSQFKEKISAEGLLTNEQMEGVTNLAELFEQVKTARDSLQKTLPDSLKVDIPKAEKFNTASSKSFKDRLYGGADFDWKNSTNYYPDGLGITLTGGFKVTDNSGLAIEFNSLFNGGQMGFTEDLRFKETLVSNYTIGANIDHKIWKIIYAGAGAEVICNNMEAPARETLNEIENIDYTLGIPVFIRAILPISGSGSSNLEFRYDLNSDNNIKPRFNFKVGFLIGR